MNAPPRRATEMHGKSITPAENAPKRAQDARRAFAEVRAAMAADYAELRNWREVARRWRVSKGVAWRVVVKGVEPVTPAIRDALCLAPTATVVSVNGPLPDGTQVTSWRMCANPDCNNTFADNNPQRRYCYECRPKKGKEYDGV